MATITEGVRSKIDVAGLGEHWGWLLALGVVQIAAGALAIAAPMLASLAAVLVFGGVLIASAIFQVIHAFKTRRWSGSAWYVLGAVLYAAAGVLVVAFPLEGVLTLAIIIATLLVAEGALRVLVATLLKPARGWGWWLAAGMASVLLGVMLFLGWPAVAVWAVGLLLGVNLIFSGATHAALAITSKSMRTRTE